MTEDHSPWEVGLGFCVNLAKAVFRGKQAVQARANEPAFNGVGISIGLVGGETLWANGQEVGAINSPAYSHRLQKV